MSGWIKWRGYKCPVETETPVHVKLKGDRGNEGLRLRPRPAGVYKWVPESGIIAYRLSPSNEGRGT